MTFLFYEYLAKSPSRNKKCQFKQKSFSIIKKYDISKYIRKLLKERSIFPKCKGDIMERNLKVYQMVYTIPYGISENFFLGFLGFFGSFSKSYMCIVIFSVSFFYFIYKEKKR